MAIPVKVDIGPIRRATGSSGALRRRPRGLRGRPEVTFGAKKALRGTQNRSAGQSSWFGDKVFWNSGCANGALGTFRSKNKPAGHPRWIRGVVLGAHGHVFFKLRRFARRPWGIPISHTRFPLPAPTPCAPPTLPRSPKANAPLRSQRVPHSSTRPPTPLPTPPCTNTLTPAHTYPFTAPPTHSPTRPPMPAPNTAPQSSNQPSISCVHHRNKKCENNAKAI